jgi:hypothetical protein
VKYFVSDEVDTVSRRYGVDANPTAVIIDATGRVSTYGNPMRVEDLEEMIAQDVREPAAVAQ